MNKINNIAFSSFGLVFSKITGVLDMPSRTGATTYDWGDYIEPLVHKEDIIWKSKTIKLTVLFNGNRFNKTLSQCLLMLESLPREFPLHTAYGEFPVSLKKVHKSKDFTEEYAILELEFEQSKDLFIKNKPAISGGNGIKIDDYDLKNGFGIIVSKAKFSDDVSEFKKVQANEFKTVDKKTQKLADVVLPPYHRKLKQLLLDCVIPFDTIQEVAEKTAQFQKIVSLYGFRTVLLGNQSYKCFLTDGFSIKEFDTYVKFTLKLNIAQNEDI